LAASDIGEGAERIPAARSPVVERRVPARTTLRRREEQRRPHRVRPARWGHRRDRARIFDGETGSVVRRTSAPLW